MTCTDHKGPRYVVFSTPVLHRASSSTPSAFVHSIYIKNLLITYLLTPCSRVLLEKITDFQLVKKFPVFYGTRKFITAFTSDRHLSLLWASSIQSTPQYHTSWRSILILSSNLCLGLTSGLFPSGFPTKTLYTPLLSPIQATCPAHPIFLDFIILTVWGEEYRSFSSSTRSFLHSHVTSSLLGPNIYKTALYELSLQVAAPLCSWSGYGPATRSLRFTLCNNLNLWQCRSTSFASLLERRNLNSVGCCLVISNHLLHWAAKLPHCPGDFRLSVL